jgi:hypothetical protein
MTKIDDYRRMLQRLEEWDSFLLKESGLPGPRGNLELAYAVAQEGDKERFKHFLTYHAEENTPEVFVIFCGVMGLGKLAASQPELFDQLREYASDPRWRIREAVATGLQLTGDQNMGLLLRKMKRWIKGNWYTKRAAVAALAEPRLLRQPKHARQVLQILDTVTRWMETIEQTRDDSFKVFRQALGYCWSVAVAALPEEGKPIMEHWLTSEDKDVRWVMKENLKKNRLIKMDAGWVKSSMSKLDSFIVEHRENAIPAPNDFSRVFEQLKKILSPYARDLALKTDTEDLYSLDGSYSKKWKKKLFFGAAQIKKNYVSFYLMPIYMYPELLKDISPELKKHMQGKSCFNFKKVEPDLFKELETLTHKGAEKIKEENDS